VEILRNGVRTVAEGTGNEDELRLSLLPATADVKAGDTIVTSGLGGVFPAGIPVGTVVQAVRDPDDILARVRVKPRAALARDRQVMALWFNPENPEAPVNPALVRDLPEPTLASPVLAPPQPAATKPAAEKKAADARAVKAPR
jgi:rod shape-determining protein MreC